MRLVVMGASEFSGDMFAHVFGRAFQQLIPIRGEINLGEGAEQMPFGGGAHMCLGLHFAYMQIKILMHAMLTQNRVLLQGGPDYEPKWQVFPIPQPKDGLPVRLERL